MSKYASWNNKAKYYVITEDGKKGIQGRTKPGDPPPDDCELKNCSGMEFMAYRNEGQAERQKKELNQGQENEIQFVEAEQEPGPDPEENEKDSGSGDWFASIFGN